MSVTMQFDRDLDTVWTQLQDPDFRVERSLALGELSADCEIEDFGDSLTVAMQREVTRELPSVLAKVFNPKQTMNFTEGRRLARQYANYHQGPAGGDFSGDVPAACRRGLRVSGAPPLQGENPVSGWQGRKVCVVSDGRWRCCRAEIPERIPGLARPRAGDAVAAPPASPQVPAIA